MNRFLFALLGLALTQSTTAETKDSLSYNIEARATAGGGDFAPIWFSANKYGLSSVKPNSGLLKAGLEYNKNMKYRWKLKVGVDLAGGYDLTQNVIVQQAYADIAWRCLQLSVGSKERKPLGKDIYLSSGAMVEEGNARPIPQIRAEIEDYVAVPGTKKWLSFKGHFAYGVFTDGNWQEDFAAPYYKWFMKKTLYHSKSAMFRIGNTEKRPWEFEIGLLVSTQFGGEQYKWNWGSRQWEVMEMPHGFKDLLKAIIPTQGGADTPDGDQVNVAGNFIGSWNAAFTYYWKDWKFRAYYEHLFEDESQMFMQYGRWKDGHLGLEVTFPKNPFVTKVLWEGLSTKDQSGPILYDGFLGNYDHQISASDNYYNNYFYQGWSHWGQGMGNPLLPGPIYNKDGSMMFRSNRTRANHVAFCGNPTEEWNYRVKLSYAEHWGIYINPLDKMMRQFSSMYEVGYQPKPLRGWSFNAALGWDQGDYIGNSVAGMITIKKEGVLWKR